MKIVLVMFVLLTSSIFAGTSWEDSPYNWDNSEHNWENNPNNWNSDRIMRDNDGNPTGYAVPNSNGVINIYDLEGNREGYVPN